MYDEALATELGTFVRESSAAAGPGECLVGGTEVLESLLGFLRLPPEYNRQMRSSRSHHALEPHPPSLLADLSPRFSNISAEF